MPPFNEQFTLNVTIGNESSFREEMETATTESDYFSPDYDQYTQQCQLESFRNFRSWFMPIFYSVICFFGFVGNLLVILTFYYFKRLKTMTDVYLLNLSFADLLVALSLPLWASNAMTKWVLGLAACKMMYTVYKVSFYSGMFLLTCISMDRYFAISKAVSAHRHRSRAVFWSKASSVGIWLLALLCSVPEMNYTHINNNTCTPYAVNSDNLRVGIQVSQMVLGFGVPFLVMGFCYYSIVRTLWQARSFEKNKAIKVIFAVVAVFLLCQLPYNFVLVLTTLDTVNGGTKNCRYFNSLIFASDVTQCMAFLRCSLNPFVYAFIGVKFRHDLMKLLKDLGCISHESFYKYTCHRRRSSAATDTETTTTFSP
ncbi:C-C chemokine receptor type 7 isoform X1 [Hypomesus transpacificus]|uniref:C-C chemokine receptor type 7 isoform X1 n=1 Tax=Hypomesus transpacificus TaxID=137520 RepID=UPI001F08221B|nr:C-C chemokine receptor type 7 isoform X1 [Hypomesus transpacificus]